MKTQDQLDFETERQIAQGERAYESSVLSELNAVPPWEEYDEEGDAAGNIGEFYEDNHGYRRCDCEDFPCCGH